MNDRWTDLDAAKQLLSDENCIWWSTSWCSFSCVVHGFANGWICICFAAEGSWYAHALTKAQEVATQVWMHTGFPIGNPSETQICAWSYFAPYVKNVDGDFSQVSARAKDNPFDEGIAVDQPPLAYSWFYATTIITSDDSSLGLMKSFAYEVAPNTLIADSVNHHRITNNGKDKLDFKEKPDDTLSKTGDDSAGATNTSKGAQIPQAVHQHQQSRKCTRRRRARMLPPRCVVDKRPPASTVLRTPSFYRNQMKHETFFPISFMDGSVATQAVAYRS